jgi:hypothetical protein
LLFEIAEIVKKKIENLVRTEVLYNMQRNKNFEKFKIIAIVVNTEISKIKLAVVKTFDLFSRSLFAINHLKTASVNCNVTKGVNKPSVVKNKSKIPTSSLER